MVPTQKIGVKFEKVVSPSMHNNSENPCISKHRGSNKAQCDFANNALHQNRDRHRFTVYFQDYSHNKVYQLPHGGLVNIDVGRNKFKF